MNLVLLLAIAYTVGSFPTAYIVGRFTRGIDVREHGSGNVGATNVMRVLGMGLGLLTLAIDLVKGYVVVALIAPAFCPNADWLPLSRVLSCVAVIAGHNWMIFLGFRGGKGVATTAGAFLALSPVVTLLSFGIWGFVVALTRYVSLGSLCAGVALAVFMWVFDQPALYVWFSVLIAAVLIFTHRGNVKRLISGTERKLGKSEKVGE